VWAFASTTECVASVRSVVGGVSICPHNRRRTGCKDYDKNSGTGEWISGAARMALSSGTGGKTFLFAPAAGAWTPRARGAREGRARWAGKKNSTDPYIC
jgi:hypothetical protein